MEEEFGEQFSDESDNEDYEHESIISKDIDIMEFYKNYDKNKKKFKTPSILSKYEKTRGKAIEKNIKKDKMNKRYGGKVRTPSNFGL